jgi:hypothetical protein
MRETRVPTVWTLPRGGGEGQLRPEAGRIRRNKERENARVKGGPKLPCGAPIATQESGCAGCMGPA